MKKPLLLNEGCKKLLFIVNPVAGRKLYKRYLGECIQTFMDAGYLVTVYFTQCSGDGERFASLCAGEFDRVVCLGGDGTLGQVASGLLSSGKAMPLGYIPAGSSNDFGALHGLSSDILTAARDAVGGREKLVDTGVFNGKGFAYVAAFGAFSSTSYTTPQPLKNTLGHQAYFFDSVRDLPKLKAEHMRVEANGEVFEGDYIFGAFCNNTNISGIICLPENTVETDDGLFEAVLIETPTTLPEWSDTLYSVLTGDYISHRIHFFHTDKLVIEADGAPDWTLDGEYYKGDKNVVIEVRQKSLRILTPPIEKTEEPLP